MRDGEDQRVVVQRRVSVAELAGVLDLHRQPRQGLDLILAHQRRVPACAAGRHHEPPHRAKLLRREIQAAELGRRRVEIQPPAQGVLDRFGLLEDFLEHVVVVAAGVDIARLQLQRLDPRIDVARVAVANPHLLRGEHGQLVVCQIDDLVGVAGQWRGVAGHEMLAVADAQHERAALPGDDQHARPVAKEDGQAVSSLKLAERLPHRVDQWPVVEVGHVFHFGLLPEAACHEMGDDLSIGSGMKDEALFDESPLERAEVLDDAVVDDGHLAVAAKMRMGVGVARRAVGGPAGVADAGAPEVAHCGAWFPGGQSARPT